MSGADLLRTRRHGGGQSACSDFSQRNEPVGRSNHPIRRSVSDSFPVEYAKWDITVLMIRRRCGESVLVGEDIEIRVLEVAGGRVKLGISAPRNVLVLRDELKLTEDFNREASHPAPISRLISLAAALAGPGKLTRR